MKAPKTQTVERPLIAIGEPKDAQYQLVVDSLRAKGAPVAAINIHSPDDFAVTISRSGEATFWLAGGPIEPALLWYRLKFLDLPLKSILSRDFDGVRRTEWLAFVTGISLILQDRLAHSESFVPSASKLCQLVLAGEAGFSTPATVAGIGRSAAEAFARQHASVIIKGLHATNMLRASDPDELEAFITTELSLEELIAADDDEFRACPYFLQERLDNANEHRVIAFGDNLFCYRLVDPPGLTPFVDRRIMKPGFEAVPTPPALPALVREFFARSGLRYGAFDLIFLPDTIVFLECNPEGQWHSANDLDLPEVVDRFSAWMLTL